MSGSRVRLTLVFAVLAVCSLATQAPAWAQAEDGWSFIITPQVWLSHIAKNGFGPTGGAFELLSTEPGLTNVDSKHTDGVSPQWGLQLAAQKGRWTLSGAFQYVNFETQNNVTAAKDIVDCYLELSACSSTIAKGSLYAREHVETTRMDVDFALTYFIPDVITNRADVSVGLGGKFIYASSSRQFEPTQATFTPVNPLTGVVAGPSFRFPVEAFYGVCRKDNGSDCVRPATFLGQQGLVVVSRKERVQTKDYFYGATIPMSVITHLTKDGKWLFPFAVTPFLGVENRDDQDVAYAVFRDPAGNPTGVRRLDGMTFAYGVTADATVRWLINETLSAYAGMRVQYIQGHEKYLAYGPLVGMSVRFGGK